ncbi:MAG: ClbS/DfsB family four-helix bundle protein [Thermomicrobiales bacterium]|nr:ClbS/DfsB family four-helix bundle protein [Thermomicrobiales bacterium]
MPELSSRADLLSTLQSLSNDIDQLASQVNPELAAQPNTFGDWSFKDVIAHLNSWRLLTAARLEAGVSGKEPELPWPSHLDEDRDIDGLNRWLYESNQDKSLDEIMTDSRATFERSAAAISAMPEDALMQVGHFSWLSGYALGPAVVQGTWEHFHIDHEPEIRAWLKKQGISS